MGVDWLFVNCMDAEGRLVEQHRLGPIGRGYRKGRGSNGRITYVFCPFHSEKSQSFAVYSASVTRSGQPHFNCFGCQWEGDLVALVANLRGTALGFLHPDDPDRAEERAAVLAVTPEIYLWDGTVAPGQLPLL